jgi:hypothetical protein
MEPQFEFLLSNSWGFLTDLCHEIQVHRSMVRVFVKNFGGEREKHGVLGFSTVQSERGEGHRLYRQR